MSLFLLLNPKQYGGAVQPDTSDILDVYRRKRRREEEELEERIAAQLLQARQKDVVIPEEVDPVRLADVLRDKMYSNIRAGEVTGDERIRKIKWLLIALAMDD